MTWFSQKLTRCEEYFRARAYHDYLGEVGMRPRLVIVVPDRRRERKLVSWMARRLSRGEFSSLCAMDTRAAPAETHSFASAGGGSA